MSSSENEKPIDLESLERVVWRLREVIADYKKTPDNLYILDSIIKRFELAYELSTRALRRYLVDRAISSADTEDKSFQWTIREADKLGLLLHGWPEWKAYRDARNETAHVYHEPKAREIAEAAQPFLVDAEYLLENLKRRLANRG